jgi:hypothetical protein
MDALSLLQKFMNPVKFTAYSKKPNIKNVFIQWDVNDDVFLISFENTFDLRFSYILKETEKGTKYILAMNETGNRKMYLSIFGPHNLTKTPKKKKATMCAELCSSVDGSTWSSTLFMYKT